MRNPPNIASRITPRNARRLAGPNPHLDLDCFPGRLAALAPGDIDLTQVPLGGQIESLSEGSLSPHSLHRIVTGLRDRLEFGERSPWEPPDLAVLVGIQNAQRAIVIPIVPVRIN